MAEDDGSAAPAENVQSLLRLAQDRSEASRRELFDNVVELFIADDHRLSERERTLMAGILDRLVSEVEVAVRGDLAERLAKMPDAPAERGVLLDLVAQFFGEFEHRLGVDSLPGSRWDVVDNLRAVDAIGDCPVVLEQAALFRPVVVRADQQERVGTSIGRPTGE